MRIFLASDHAGFELKSKLLQFLSEKGYKTEDCGAHDYDESDDYPDFISLVAEEVSKNPEESRGIIIGGSGQGEAIVANRFAHVRATVYYGGDETVLSLSREHNNANILSLGARFLAPPEAQQAVKVWLETDFSADERHIRRIKKIEHYG